MWNGGFYKYKHLYTVERYIFTKKDIEHGFEHDVDSSYGVCIYQTLMNFTADSVNTLQFKQMMNLTMCWLVTL